MAETTTRDLQPQSLQSLADKAATLHGRSLALWRECADVVLEAKRAARHGGWSQFLEQAGISEGTARRMLRIAERGIALEFIQSVGGVSPTLRFLDNIDFAVELWSAACKSEWRNCLSKNEQADMVQRYPDFLTLHLWLDWSEAIDEHGMDAAWTKRPWVKSAIVTDLNPAA